MEPIIDHVEITVGDMATAVRFYDRLLPLLGFDLAKRTEALVEAHEQLQAIGATIVTPPREYPEYAPGGYYALYFKDPEGIKYEIVCIGGERS